MEEVPLCAAAAIHRGPSTVTRLKSRTSQKPITRGGFGLGCSETASPTRWGPDEESFHPALKNSVEKDPWNFPAPARFRKNRLRHQPEISLDRRVFSRDAYHA